MGFMEEEYIIQWTKGEGSYTGGADMTVSRNK